MAEIILSAFFEALFTKLALERMGRGKRIREQLQKTESWLHQIQALLIDAGQRPITDEYVQKWLYDLQDLAYEIDDVLDDLATKSMQVEKRKVRNTIPTCFNGLSLGTNKSDKLDHITNKLQLLESQKNTLGLTEKAGKSKDMTRRLEATSLPVDIVGRQGDKERLLEKLLGDEPSNQNFSILPIVGVGGIGKTTLAQFLYNEAQVKEKFELKAWVCVSDEFDILKMSKIIFQTVTGENKEFADLNLLQVALREKLMEKRFLLVLDDIWSESCEEWETLVRPFLAGAPRSKIIITTRKQQLLKKLGYDRPYLLQSLSHDDALILFSQHALGVNNFDLHPTLRPIGEAIVKKCDGLPLALIALGRLLRTKTNEEEWKELLDDEIWRLQEGNEIIPALKLSYLDLCARLKRLFAYCSLFPKDYLFDKKELILLWMAEGFLHHLATSKSMERVGSEYFDELLLRSFFVHAPNDESLFIMHDMMNDLAKFVAGDFFLRSDNEMELKGITKEALQKCRHVSFVRQKYGTYEKFKIYESAKCLRTFLALSVGKKKSWDKFYLSNKILVDLFCELPLLRVLCLSDYEISDVPNSICRLIHLRYLNLSQTGITHLPESISDLYNLQTLLVYGCRKLTKLPHNFSKLKNLRHLDINETPLLGKLPVGIGELKCIQTLNKVIIEKANGFEITELKHLKDLHGRISIKGLDKVKSTMDVKKANLLDKEFNELEMEWSNVFDMSRNETLEKEVLNMLKPHNDRLRKLVIMSYGGIEFPTWVSDPSFTQLTHVTIGDCKRCTYLPSFVQLPSLKELYIKGMDNVNVLHSELLGSSLEILSFVDMPELRLWSMNSENAGTMLFPCLRKLSIKRCPCLVKASLGTLPSLQRLTISGCQDVILRILVKAGASTVTKLKIKNIFRLTRLQGGIMEYLGVVVDLFIVECHEMKYLWESEAEASKSLPSLKTLKIWSCNNLLSLGNDTCGSNLTSLRKLAIYHCNTMGWIVGCAQFSHILPSSLATLSITELESLSMGLEDLTSLRYLYIRNCRKMRDLPKALFPSILELNISKCPNLKESCSRNGSYWTRISHIPCIEIDEEFGANNNYKKFGFRVGSEFGIPKYSVQV